MQALKKTNILFLLIFTFLFSSIPFQWTGTAQAPTHSYNRTAEGMPSVAELSQKIDKVLSHKHLSTTKFAVAIYSERANQYIYKKNIDQPLVPASNSKLVTTYTLLKNFGKDYTLNTDIYTDADSLSSVLDGNVYLFGKGDGLLSISDLEDLADQLYRQGIREIKGSVYADPSFFDSETERIQYSSDKDLVEATAPITSISLDRNIATILVKANSNIGNKVSVQVIPKSPAFNVVVNAKIVGKSGGKGKGKKKQAARNVNSIKVTTKANADGTQTFFVNGNLTKSLSTSYTHYIKNAPLVAAGSLKERIKALGIKINGNFSSREMSHLENQFLKIATVKRDVFKVIDIVNKESNNWLAETLFKALGSLSNKDARNVRAAQELIDNTMKTNQIPFEDCVINDGSGLARQTKVSAKTFIQLLLDANKSPFSEKFFNSLAIAGVDGTIKKRFSGSAVSHRVAAKTGTHRNVSSLSGRMQMIRGDYLFFSFIFNGPNVGFYKGIENSLLELLTDFEKSNH